MKPARLLAACAPLFAVALVAAGRVTDAAPAGVQFVLATLHAAALTTARSATDATDEPYLLLTTLPSGGAPSTTRFPATERMTIRLDEALGARPLTALSLQPGESTRLLITALEGPANGETHTLGSVIVLVTNEGGNLFWRSTECVATCRLLTQPASAELPAANAAPLGSVAELTGNGGTYHLNLQGAKAP